MSETKLDGNSSYRVLARKYRPSKFSDLVGQDVMVKILKNSFLSKRIPHAFMLTGVRGTGKTTTARIVAKALNCVGGSDPHGPDISPCGECETCKSITQGNNVDVLEVDAASRTGVADIREIIDNVRYRAASARYKIYIVDEVHMLSISAFNALLKTLEEPPAHVKFIFATTEIKKVPTTILSRCQRFDLRRIEANKMVKYLEKIAKEEGFSIDTDCLGQIARASEGSMRDALSLLEQVLVDSKEPINIKKVRAILGLADRGRIIELFKLLCEGDICNALEKFNLMYSEGGDPVALIKELSELTHWITVTKVSPGALQDVTLSPEEESQGIVLSKKLSVAFLARLWQLLLKIVEETSIAIDAKMTAEMGLIRVAYASGLPTPGDVIKSMSMDHNIVEKTGKVTPNDEIKPSNQAIQEPGLRINNEMETANGESVSRQAKISEDKSEINFIDGPESFKRLVELIRVRREIELLIEVEDNLRLVSYKIGRIEFEPTKNAATNLASRLTKFLAENTGHRWVVSVVSQGGGATLKEEKLITQKEQEMESMRHPLVAAVFEFFPNSKLAFVHNKNEHISSSDGNSENYPPNHYQQSAKKE